MVGRWVRSGESYSAGELSRNRRFSQRLLAAALVLLIGVIGSSSITTRPSVAAAPASVPLHMTQSGAAPVTENPVHQTTQLAHSDGSVSALLPIDGQVAPPPVLQHELYRWSSDYTPLDLDPHSDGVAKGIPVAPGSTGGYVSAMLETPSGHLELLLTSTSERGSVQVATERLIIDTTGNILSRVEVEIRGAGIVRRPDGGYASIDRVSHPAGDQYYTEGFLVIYDANGTEIRRQLVGTSPTSGLLAAMDIQVGPDGRMYVALHAMVLNEFQGDAWLVEVDALNTVQTITPIPSAMWLGAQILVRPHAIFVATTTYVNPTLTLYRVDHDGLTTLWSQVGIRTVRLDPHGQHGVRIFGVTTDRLGVEALWTDASGRVVATGSLRPDIGTLQSIQRSIAEGVHIRGRENFGRVTTGPPLPTPPAPTTSTTTTTTAAPTTTTTTAPATTTTTTTAAPTTTTTTTTPTTTTTVPISPPGPVRNVQVTELDPGIAAAAIDAMHLAVTWDPPLDDGGSPIMGYVITTTPGTRSITVGPSVRSLVISDLAADTEYRVHVAATNAAGTNTATKSAAITIGAQSVNGYWMLETDGTVYDFGDVPHHGDAPAGTTAIKLVGTHDGKGYWILAADGQVHALGTAAHHGDLLTAPVDLEPAEVPSTLSALPDDSGYWIFTNAGRVIAYGAAEHYGDVAHLDLNGPIIDSIATPTGRGYWQMGSDGGIFASGDAAFHGSIQAFLNENLAGVPATTWLNEPIVAIVAAPTNNGYWLVAADGGTFSFGDAPFRGSVPAVLAQGATLNRPINGMVAYGNGYLMTSTDGGVFTFSNLDFYGSLPRPGWQKIRDLEQRDNWCRDANHERHAHPIRTPQYAEYAEALHLCQV